MRRSLNIVLIVHKLFNFIARLFPNLSSDFADHNPAGGLPGSHSDPNAVANFNN